MRLTSWFRINGKDNVSGHFRGLHTLIMSFQQGTAFDNEIKYLTGFDRHISSHFDDFSVNYLKDRWALSPVRQWIINFCYKQLNQKVFKTRIKKFSIFTTLRSIFNTIFNPHGYFTGTVFGTKCYRPKMV